MKAELCKTSDKELNTRGFYGSKMHLEDHRFALVISYDDIEEEDLERFCKADIEIIFKKFELVSVFLFNFRQYLIDAPFDLFATYERWKDWRKNEEDIFLDILICDSESGNVLEKRVVQFPRSFCHAWLQMLSDSYEDGISNYRSDIFQKLTSELYDNHTIDEIYKMQGEQIVMCTAK